MSRFLSFIAHHKSSIIGVISALCTYLLGKGLIGIDELQLITNILATVGIAVNIALPRK